MKIKKIILKNFRSIVDAEIEVDDFNVFVGQNNHGKTNLFEAIEFFFNGVNKSYGAIENLIYKKDATLQMSVEIQFIGAQDGVNKMVNEKTKHVMLSALDGSDCVSFIRKSNTPKIRTMIFLDGVERKQPTGFDQALNDFLPRFEYIHTRQYHDEVAKYSKSTPIGIMLSGVLVTFLEADPTYKKLKQSFSDLFENNDSSVKIQLNSIGEEVKIQLAKQFPDCNKVNFEVTMPGFDDLLKNFTTSIDDGIVTYAEEKGDGMQRALMLAIIQAYARFRKGREDVNKSFLFFIDEAELHLHPTAQRKLKYVLHELSIDMDQVFINTHSSVFIADEVDKQIIFQVEKNDGKTIIEKINKNQKQKVIYELLGGSPTDLLLPANFLIVEGKTEVEFLTKIINRFYSEKIEIVVIAANGDVDKALHKKSAIENVYNVMDNPIYADKVVIMLDKPSEQTNQKVNKFGEKLGDRLFQLPFCNIEDYYPSELHHLSSKNKIKYAQSVGNSITKQQFETKMTVCFKALQKTWDSAYARN